VKGWEGREEVRDALQLLQGPRCLTLEAQATLCFVTQARLFGLVESDGTGEGQICAYRGLVSIRWRQELDPWSSALGR